MQVLGRYGRVKETRAPPRFRGLSQSIVVPVSCVLFHLPSTYCTIHLLALIIQCHSIHTRDIAMKAFHKAAGAARKRLFRRSVRQDAGRLDAEVRTALVEDVSPATALQKELEDIEADIAQARESLRTSEEKEVFLGQRSRQYVSVHPLGIVCNGARRRSVFSHYSRLYSAGLWMNRHDSSGTNKLVLILKSKKVEMATRKRRNERNWNGGWKNGSVTRTPWEPLSRRTRKYWVSVRPCAGD